MKARGSENLTRGFGPLPVLCLRLSSGLIPGSRVLDPMLMCLRGLWSFLTGEPSVLAVRFV